MKNLNTKEYWNKIWSKYRQADARRRLVSATNVVIHQEFWDKIPAKNPKGLPFAMYRAWFYAKKFNIQSALDIGCGNGRLLFGLGYLLQGCRLFGIDITSAGIDRMKKEYDIDGAVLGVENLDQIDWKSDMVILDGVLEHLENDEQVIKDCQEKLTPGGWLFINVPNDKQGPEEDEAHLRKYTKESLENLIKKYFNKYSSEVILGNLIILAQNV